MGTVRWNSTTVCQALTFTKYSFSLGKTVGEGMVCQEPCGGSEPYQENIAAAEASQEALSLQSLIANLTSNSIAQVSHSIVHN